MSKVKRPIGGTPEELIIPIIELQAQYSEMGHCKHALTDVRRIFSSDRGHFFLRSLASVSIGKIPRIFRIFKYKPCNVTSKFVPFSEIPARFNVF